MWGLKYPWNESALQRPRWCWSFPFPYPTAAERVEMEERESEAVSKPGGRTPPRARMSGGRPRPRACLLVGPSGRAREFNGRHTTKSDACKSEARERVEGEREGERNHLCRRCRRKERELLPAIASDAAEVAAAARERRPIDSITGTHDDTAPSGRTTENPVSTFLAVAQVHVWGTCIMIRHPPPPLSSTCVTFVL